MAFDISQIALLDGAMGTMLQKSGLKPGEIPELKNIEHPAMIAAVHRAYIDAGSQVVYANTFGANRRKLKKTGYSVAEVVSARWISMRFLARGREDIRPFSCW